jgi:hypothetical protein
MPDLPRVKQNVLRWYNRSGAARVNVLLLTGFPQNLFGCASDIGWLAPIRGEVGGRNVLAVRSGAFLKQSTESR